jgi:polyferredoxin
MPGGEQDQKFRRWQKITINQLGYTLNLVLTLAIAALGFFFSLLKDKDFVPTGRAQCALILSFLGLAVSSICGVCCILNRLRDFRGTARRTRNHLDAPTKEELDGFGKLTWALFYVDVWAFVLGIGALTIALLITYGRKLI